MTYKRKNRLEFRFKNNKFIETARLVYIFSLTVDLNLNSYKT